MGEKIYSFWIKGELTIINYLTIKSFQDNGHEFIIYSYDNLNLNGLSCEVRDAREILPDSAIFYYNHLGESCKFGGIAERLKAEMLYKLGGWHVDLDVTCLQPFDILSKEYVLRPHHKCGVVGNIIKAPKESELAKRYIDWTRTIDANNVDWDKSFRGLSGIVGDLNLSEFVVDKEILGDDSWLYWGRFLHDGVPSPELMAIHNCAASYGAKRYHAGSFIESLVIKHGLLELAQKLETADYFRRINCGPASWGWGRK